MDPFSALASGIALFDGLKEFYRFAQDAYKASSERHELQVRFDSMHSTLRNTAAVLDNCVGEVKDRKAALWIQTLEGKDSPLYGLQQIIEKMSAELVEKKTKVEKFWKDLKWHSEKKHLEEDFVAIAHFCRDIRDILNNAQFEISIGSVQEQQKTRGMLEELHKKFDSQGNEQKLKDEKEERKEIEAWLSTLDFQARQREVFKEAEETGRNGNWFLNLPAFKIWEDGSLKLLQCYGSMGTGKTVLASITVDYMAKAHSKVPTLVLYLEEAPRDSHDPENLLGSLIKQLIQLRPDEPVSPVIIEARKNAKSFNAGRPSFGELKTLFETEIKNLDRVHVVISGQDRAIDETRSFIKATLRRNKKLKLLILTRRDEEPTDKCVNCDTCENKDLVVFYRCNDCWTKKSRWDMCSDCQSKGEKCPVDPVHKMTLAPRLEVTILVPNEELKLYVRTRIEGQMPPEDDDEDFDEDTESANAESTPLGRICQKDTSFMSMIVDFIVANSHQKFLLAKLYTNAIMDHINKGEILKAVGELSEGNYSLSEWINQRYDKDLSDRIENNVNLSQNRKDFAKKTLSLVYHTKRELSFQELQSALAVIPGQRHYDSNYETAKHEILQLTKGFITIGQDPEQTVKFDDRVLKSYFDTTHHRWFPTGEAKMAQLCQDYLSLDVFAERCEEEELRQKEKEFPFLSYAAENWGDHVRQAGRIAAKEAATFLQDSSRIQAYIQAAWETNTRKRQRWDVRRDIHALHICAWFDLCDVFHELDYRAFDIDIQEKTYGQTPLIYACRRGNIGMARLLLDYKASINIQSSPQKGSRTALHEAIAQKDLAIVELLLNPSHGQIPDVNARDSLRANRTALMIAIIEDQTDIALALLKHPDILLNITDKYGYTALALASYNNRQEIVDELLGAKFFGKIALDLQDGESGRSALAFATENNYTNIVKALLEAGADINLRDLRQRTPIFRAVEHEALETFHMLALHNAHLKLTDELSRTLMHVAAEIGQLELINFLREHSLEVDARDLYSMTPLHRACAMGQVKAVKLLLSFGADRNKMDEFGRTPNILAWQYGFVNIMDLCTIDGVEQPNDDDLPVWSLVREGDLESLKIAQRRRESEFRTGEPGTGKTNFHLAIESHLPGESDESDPSDENTTCSILKMLFDSPARDLLDTPDANKQTPLQVATCFSRLKTTKMLLEHNAKVDQVNRGGRTALYNACVAENYTIAMYLIEAGAVITLKSGVDIQQLLFSAIALENLVVVRKLMAMGADIMGQDERGRTPKGLARQMDNTEIYQALLPYKSNYIKVSSRKGSGISVSTTEVQTKESPVDDVPDIPALTLSFKKIPFKPFRSRLVQLDWNDVKDVEEALEEKRVSLVST